MKLKNIFCILLIGLTFKATLLACFIDQPKNLFPKVVTADFDNGASWEVQFDNIKRDKINTNNSMSFFWYDNSDDDGNAKTGWLDSWFIQKSITDTQKSFYQFTQVLAKFPLTINCTFNPFQITNEDIKTSDRVLRDQNGNAIALQEGQTMNDTSKITRFCLLYWGKNKRWIVLKDIKNPNVKVITNTSDRQALFGKYVFQNKYGFKNKQIIFMVAYFETKNNLKSYKYGLEVLMKKMPHELDGVIKIGVLQNQKPK